MISVVCLFVSMFILFFMLEMQVCDPITLVDRLK